jgi:hypothetical protein
VPPELSPDPTGPRPVELDADVEPCAQDYLGGQRAPRLAVERYLDAAL